MSEVQNQSGAIGWLVDQPIRKRRWRPHVCEMAIFYIILYKMDLCVHV